MPKFQINGSEAKLSDNLINQNNIYDGLELVQVIEVSQNRSSGKLITLDLVNENDVVIAEFQDGHEWIGSNFDFIEIFPDDFVAKTRGSNKDESVTLPIGVTDSSNRGIFKKFKFLNIFRSKKVVAGAGRALAKLIDKKLCPAPGLKRINEDFELTPFTAAEEEVASNEYFLFLHGTISNTKGSFNNLKEHNSNGVWTSIFDKYQQNVLALEHYTLSKSPIENARDALKSLPVNAKLNLISGSRGGMVGDILAMCDSRNKQPGFSKGDLFRLRDLQKNKNESDLAKEINKLAKEKSIEVHKNIRVACPANGTHIVGKRMDHWLNAILTLVGIPFGGKSNPIYGATKELITGIIKTRSDVNVMPGLLAMVPGSYLTKILNNRSHGTSDDLYVIQGNAAFGKFGRSVLVILTKLYFLKSNDFVVNTDSMRLGLKRNRGHQWKEIKDGTIHHLYYFKHDESQKLIKKVIDAPAYSAIAGFEHSTIGERGPLLKVFNLKEENRQHVSGKKPIVIIVPGIMGSHLYQGEEKIWLDFENISKGMIASALAVAPNDNVKALSVVGNYYSALADYLEPKYDVYFLPYDWRRSLEDAGEDLKETIAELSQHNQPIKILAHSMGGAVVRSMILSQEDEWKEYIGRKESQFIMLGTPWYGSYLIMEVLTGKSSTVNKLAFLDMKNSKSQLTKIFHEYPGVFELLPNEEDRDKVKEDTRIFEDPDFWKSINTTLDKGRHQIIIPPEDMLEKYAKVKNAVRNKTAKIDFSKIYYIAGKASWTTDDFGYKRSLFSKKLVFKQTPKGDGSVTWKAGIPKGLDVANLYYTKTVHGELANDPKLFSGIMDILTNGKTSDSAFSHDAPMVRGNQVKIADDLDYGSSNEDKDIMDFLFGIKPEFEKIEAAEQINIKVIHGDLKHSKYSVMCGHFDQDGIVSAEAYIDRVMGGALSERHSIGNYPGKIGESHFIIKENNLPKGTIIIGLGKPDELTGFRLSKSVENAVINYAMFLRDNSIASSVQQIKKGISSLLIGSGYAKLSLEVALKSILEGVDRANKIIKATNKANNNKLETITAIEFVELYEHKARNAYHTLTRIKEDKQLNITIQEEITTEHGAIKRLEYAQEQNWWDNLSTTCKVITDQGIQKTIFDYTLSSGIARVTQEQTYPSDAVVEQLLDGFSGSLQNTRAKTLFELLIPREMKDVIRNKTNILWRLDPTTAGIPWEMFHDPKVDTEPTFLKAGLIRQFIGKGYESNPLVIRSNSALVIGETQYTGTDFGQLPGALAEAKAIEEKLLNNNFKVSSSIEKTGTEVLDALCNEEYKILHISGHGVYDPANNQIGPVLGNGMYLHEGIIQNLPNVPEFVFINCCYSGQIENPLTQEKRYKFAANIGEAFIKKGANAVVVAGWAVDDSAAKTFALEVYRLMLDGYYYGEAIQLARKKCYNLHPETSTWGAFQCYGDQWYKLQKVSNKYYEPKKYITAEEVEIDLFNLLVKTEGQRDSKHLVDQINELESIIERAYASKLVDGKILEYEANIYSALDQIDLALDKYEELLSLNKATFSVKALEQFASLTMKMLVKSNKASDKEIKEAIIQLQSLSLIKATPERLSILGSAYKQLSLMYAKKERENKNKVFIQDKEAYLELMYQRYKEAEKLSDTDLEAKSYATYNRLLAYFFKESTDRNFVVQIKELESLAIDLKNGIGLQKKFYKTVFHINLMLCQLIFHEGEKADHFEAEILAAYSELNKIGFNNKFIRSEINHILFIINVHPEFISAVQDNLNTIKCFLIEILLKRIPDDELKEECPGKNADADAGKDADADTDTDTDTDANKKTGAKRKSSSNSTNTSKAKSTRNKSAAREKKKTRTKKTAPKKKTTTSSTKSSKAKSASKKPPANTKQKSTVKKTAAKKKSIPKKATNKSNKVSRSKSTRRKSSKTKK